jgi:4-amino-4-deoxy-L-arabinose transferase-like glycosyltransferase
MKFFTTQKSYLDYLLIVLIAGICFLPFLGKTSLFDWDEINFAESAREMLVSGNFLDVQINYQAFYEKPPLFFWFQAACMQLFGVNEWAARLPNALTGLATLFFLYHLGIFLKDRILAWILILICLASLLPNLYFRTGIIDPFFNLLILLSLYFFLLYTLQNQSVHLALLSGLFCGLAVLAKGPVAILFYTLVVSVYWIQLKPSKFFTFMGIAALSGILPLLVWFGTLTYLRGPDFVLNFLAYQIELFTQPVAGHDQPWFYHILVLLALGFPFSWLFLRASLHKPIDYSSRYAHFLFKTLFLSVLLIFSLSTTKIVHYSSLAWIPGCIVVGIWMREQAHFRSENGKIEWTLGLIITGIIMGIALFILGWILPEIQEYSHLIKDKFFLAGVSGPIQWTGMEWIPGAFLFGAALFLLLMRFFFKKLQPFSLKTIGIQALIMTIFLHLTSGLLAPRISEITQGPAVELYKSLRNKRVQIIAEGYKSYAPYFYAQVNIPDRPELNDKEWLIHGAIDRPVWMVTRIDRINPELEQLFNTFKLVKKSGGFAFYLRMP